MKKSKLNKKKVIITIIIIIGLVLIVTNILKNSNKYNDLSKLEPVSSNMLLSSENEIINESINESINEIEDEMADEKIEDQIENNPEDTSWDEENVEDTKVVNTKEIINICKYYLKVNYTANVVTVYTKDESGKYTVPVKAMVCSTGKATPRSGTYKISSKYRWHMLNGGVYGQYCYRITGHILFHSVPYSTNSPNTLKYTAYDKLGTTASAGCIRLTVADAMWIYNNCVSGTYVEFYGSSSPGPLGKPSAQKISSNEKCRNWDPTDPDLNNPWHGYVETKNSQNLIKDEKNETKNENNSKEKENDGILNNKNENSTNTIIKENDNTVLKNNTKNQVIDQYKNDTKNTSIISNSTNDKNSNILNDTIEKNEEKNITKNKERED